MPDEEHSFREFARLCEALADGMAATHASLIQFEGEAFGLQLESEAALLARILSTPVKHRAILTSLKLRLRRLARERRFLLQSTRRTVAALRGVCAVSLATYEATQGTEY